MFNHKEFLRVRPQGGYWAVEYNSSEANVVFGLMPRLADAESKLNKLMRMSDMGLNTVLQRHESREAAYV